MKSLRKPDTLTNYSERSYSWQQLENREKAWRNPSFFFTIKIVAESYLQNELMTEYLRKKIKYEYKNGQLNILPDKKLKKR